MRRIDAPDEQPPGRKLSALISDVDGTLLTNDATLSPRTIAAVAALRRRGLAFCLVSSRPPRGLAHLIEQLAIDTPSAAFNGAILFNPDMTQIAQHLLAPSVARRAIEILSACGAEPWVFANNEWFLRNSAGLHVAREMRALQFRPIVLKSFDEVLESAAKIVGVSPLRERVERAEEALSRELLGLAAISRSQLHSVDITHPLANKGAAFTAIAERLTIPAGEIAAIGDGGNDVAMFEKSGLSIAMGNASLAVRCAADCVTASNGRDGFAVAVERFVLAGQAAVRPPPRADG